MEELGLTEEKLTDLAAKLRIGERQLRRVFQEAFGVSPIQYLTTRRLLTAKGLLTDTSLSVTEVAMISGFGSIRRFNDAFKSHYGLSPSALRKSFEKRKVEKTIVLKLGYRPPFDWQSLLRFLQERVIPGVEEVSDGTYRRTAALWRDEKQYVGWFQVENQEIHSSVRLMVSESLAAVLPQIVQRV